MSKLTKALTAAAGNAGAGALYVEDVFNTLPYYDTYASSTTNGIDLAGEGGLVWLKKRTSVTNHFLYDTERGANNALLSNSTSAELNISNSLTSFNSDGFTLGTYSNTNTGVAWTFRKAEKFFDVVTYTGDGTVRQIPHNLGSTPAVIIVKSTSHTGNWYVYTASTGATKSLFLDTTSAATTRPEWGNTAPTDSVFTVDGTTVTATNYSGRTYVAYLFASDAGGFGDDGSESIIKCGSYTGNGSTTGPEIDLGFEPQWLMVKRTDAASNWSMKDIMRGFISSPSSVDSPTLYADSSAADGESANKLKPLATGFQPCINHSSVNSSGGNYIYIAIRRPMKTPESGTEVFTPITYTGSGSARTLAFNNPIDTAIIDWRSGSNQEGANFVAHRLLGKYFAINNTAAAVTNDKFKLDNSNGVYYPATTYNRTGNNYVTWGLTRAKEFYDVIIGGGNSVTSEVLNHNLGVTPELVLIAGTELYGNKSTSINLTQWVGWGGDYNYGAQSGFISAWNSTQITTQQYISNTTLPYSIMLFATLAGVSKVGSFSGNGSSKTIDCGFSNGARFVMIKRTDAGSNQGVTTSNWYIWDSARGLSAGNDPYLTNSLSSNFTENNTTDSIDPHSSGFIVNQNTTTDVNKSGASYIFLAIA